MRPWIALLATPLLTGAGAPPPAQWSGLVTIKGETRFARIELAADGTAALVDPAAEGAKPLALTAVRRDRGSLSFALKPGDQEVRCAGRIAGPALTGRTGDCALNLAATRPLRDLGPVFGAWRMGDGRVVAIGTMADFPQPLWLDYSSGDARYLFHRGGGRFVAGRTMAAPVPPGLSLSLRAGELLVVTGGRSEHGRRLAFAEQPIEWSNGDARLRGTLVRPLGRGAVPAVVLTQMSTPAPRDAYRTWAYFFASRGIAALIYDRRGVGRSTGDTKDSGMAELADDAVGAVHALQGLPGIDRRRVGTWGHSQGGWVAPLAAARSSDVAFVIMQSGPGVTPAEQEIFRVGASARAAGMSEAEAEAATAYERALMRWVKDGTGRSELIAAATANAHARWANLVQLVDDSLPQAPSQRSKRFWYFDPAADLARVRVPLLALYGDRDGLVPVERSKAILARALAEAGNRDVRIVTLPGAVHGMWAAARDSFAESARSRGFHPLYWPAIDSWLSAHRLGHRP